jgi:glycosyltransferase involved in cell wall biosynthesis
MTAASLGDLFFVGSVAGEERRALLASHRALLLPSRRDPWPLVAVEALTTGMPVVLGTGVGSAPDLLRIAPEAVQQLVEDSPAGLIELALNAVNGTVSRSARLAFSPQRCADLFASALYSIGEQ